MRRGSTLIVGNGLSRLSYDAAICAWPGETWACNYAYLEFGEKLTRLTGHVAVLREAIKYRAEKGLAFKIWAGNLGILPEADATFTCPGEFCKDSGTTLVAQALHEGRTIEVVGFDLGGPDVLSPGIERENKTSWVLRWRRLAQRYSLKDVRFWGYDHKPFILSDRSPTEYMRAYRHGRPHMADRKYLAQWQERLGAYTLPPHDPAEAVVILVLTGPDKNNRLVFRRDVAEKFAEKGIAKILEGVRA